MVSPFGTPDTSLCRCLGGTYQNENSSAEIQIPFSSLKCPQSNGKAFLVYKCHSHVWVNHQGPGHLNQDDKIGGIREVVNSLQFAKASGMHFACFISFNPLYKPLRWV